MLRLGYQRPRACIGSSKLSDGDVGAAILLWSDSRSFSRGARVANIALEKKWHLESCAGLASSTLMVT